MICQKFDEFKMMHSKFSFITSSVEASIASLKLITVYIYLFSENIIALLLVTIYITMYSSVFISCKIKRKKTCKNNIWHHFYELPQNRSSFGLYLWAVMIIQVHSYIVCLLSIKNSVHFFIIIIIFFLEGER